MRTFSCFTIDPRHTVPALVFIFAEDHERAIELARRELLENPDSIAVEIVENDSTIGVLRRDDAAVSNGRSLEHGE